MSLYTKDKPYILYTTYLRNMKDTNKETEQKRSRDFFTPYLEMAIANFERAKKQKDGDILKNLYVFGSYARGSEMCGDIDLIYTINKEPLEDEIDSL